MAKAEGMKKENWVVYFWVEKQCQPKIIEIFEILDETETVLTNNKKIKLIFSIINIE